MSSERPGYAWLAFGATAVVTAGCAYVAYRALTALSEDQDEVAPVGPPPPTRATTAAAAGSKPSLPVRKTPPTSSATQSAAVKSAGAASGSGASTSGLLGINLTSNGSGGIGSSSSSSGGAGKGSKPSLASKGSAGSKVCDFCKQPCQNGLPQRCSQCKAVVYCSNACSKKAWPEHKKSCKPPAAKGTTTGAATAAAPAVAPPAPTYAEVVSSDAASSDAAATASSSDGSAFSSARADATAAVASSSDGHGTPASAQAQQGSSTGTAADSSAANDDDDRPSTPPAVDSTSTSADKAPSTPPAAAGDGHNKAVSTTTKAVSSLGLAAHALESPSASFSETPGHSQGGAAGDEAESKAADGSPAPTSMEEMLAAYLRETASHRTNSLDAQFQEAVVLFISGELRQALARFQAVQAAARSTGVTDKEGEMYRWLGHAHNRLSDTAAAVKAFEEGAAFAAEHGLARQHVECLSGLGCLYRGQNQPTKAISYLRQALALVGSGVESADSRATVLCNLGASLMGTEPEEGLRCLTSAVELREDTVERLHEAGDRNGLATAVMEHASTLLNLASALYATGRYKPAKEAYEQALQVFEVIEDVDRMTKVLINLHNLSELQLKDRPAALQYRRKLTRFLSEHHQRTPEATCSVCLSSLSLDKPTEKDEEAILFLACMHGIHDACFKKWSEHHQSPEAGGTICPTCRAPVPIFES